MSEPVHAFTDDALQTDDATALAQRIRQGELSATELTKAAIDRARAVDGQLGTFASTAFEQAEAVALRIDSGSDSKGQTFFRGVPIAIKDNTDIKGLPTQHGSDAVPACPASRTSPVAKQLLAQGMICLGKSSMPEFGFNATTEPPNQPVARNPWNPDYSTGASSGGSAALVAAGVVPMAHANDGGGSIRIPAACCGLVGLKPSRGRLVNNDAATALPINILSDGIVSRSVRDTANFYREAERYFRRRRLPAIGTVSGPSGKPLRIGVVEDSITGHPTDQEAREAVASTARLLEKLGHRIVPMEVPVAATFAQDFALYWAFLAFGVTTNGRLMFHREFDRRKVDGLTRGLAKKFRKEFHRLPLALWRLRRSAQEYETAMAGLDASLTPVLGHATPPLGHLSPNVPFDDLFDRLIRYVGFTPLANTTGAPAISLPAGLGSNGLPLSVHFMARHGDERTLLDLAYTLEAERPWAILPGRAPTRYAGVKGGLSTG
ncbi:amidase [Marinobacter salinisoli]|uniref:Amidase n=1 Tax=Marinobacter salinisoli TaxID=2769486 RepID=A0ABX7MMC1_9GAMM|nr:amidase [Marinobacter salinisoli]QSP93351.1 amidase [Marinobacter salinisoli]